MLGKKTFIVFVFLFIFIYQNEKGFAKVILPPLPKLSESKEVTVVVTMDKAFNRKKIEKLLEKYPSLQLRNVYSVALDGFSLHGKMKEIEQLKKEGEFRP